jgi:hypothetical protein
MNELDLRRARQSPGQFGNELLSRRCGCFYCLATFEAREILEWVDDQVVEGERCGVTALCPRCGIDSVVEEGPGRPITSAYLRELHDRGFG